jgi:outer membrane protein assembly factor BamB
MRTNTLILFILFFISACSKDSVETDDQKTDIPVTFDSPAIVVSQITDQSVVVSANVKAPAGTMIGLCGFVWSATNNKPVVADNNVETGSFNGSFPKKFETKIASLKPNTNYFVRFYTIVKGEIYYSEVTSFKTGDPAAFESETVTTLFISTKNGLFALEPTTGIKKWVLPDVKSGGVNRYYFLPVVFGNKIIIPNSGLGAYEAATGKQIWKSDRIGDIFGPVTDGSRVYISNFATTLLSAVDIKTGIGKWQIKMTEGSRIPIVHQGVLVVNSGRKIFGFDAESGNKKWDVSLADQNVLTTPCASEGVVYVVSTNKLFAIDVKSGVVKWEVKSEIEPIVISVLNGTVYLMNQGGEADLIAFDAATGTKKWRVDYLDETKGETVDVVRLFSGDSYETLYAYGRSMETNYGNYETYIFGLDPKTGKLKWRKPIKELESIATADGILIKNVLYLSTDGKTIAVPVNSDGTLGNKILWTNSEGGVPAFVDDKGNGFHIFENGMD